MLQEADDKKTSSLHAMVGIRKLICKTILSLYIFMSKKEKTGLFNLLFDVKFCLQL